MAPAAVEEVTCVVVAWVVVVTAVSTSGEVVRAAAVDSEGELSAPRDTVAPTVSIAVAGTDVSAVAPVVARAVVTITLSLAVLATADVGSVDAVSVVAASTVVVGPAAAAVSESAAVANM